MTAISTEELARLLAETTPGIKHRITQYTNAIYHDLFIPGTNGAHDLTEADAEILALAPTLAARVLELEAENARLRNALVAVLDDMKGYNLVGGHAYASARAALNQTGGAT